MADIMKSLSDNAKASDLSSYSRHWEQLQKQSKEELKN